MHATPNRRAGGVATNLRYGLFKRVVSQAQRCDLSSPVTPNLKVAMQLTNTDLVTQTVSVDKPNTCQEQLLGTVNPGALVALLVPPESLVVVRASSGSNPIQRGVGEHVCYSDIGDAGSIWHHLLFRSARDQLNFSPAIG